MCVYIHACESAVCVCYLLTVHAHVCVCDVNNFAPHAAAIKKPPTSNHYRFGVDNIGLPQKRKSDVHSRRRVMLALEVAFAIQSDSHIFSFE